MTEVLEGRRTALVTGATGEIGRGIAERLVEKGVFVFGISSKEQKATQFTEEVGNGAKNAHGYEVDLADPKRLNNWYSETFGRQAPNFVVNAAGITNDHLLVERLDDDAVDDALALQNVNVMAAYILSRRTASVHRRTGGRTLNIGSVSPEVGSPSQAEYAMSKAALKALTRVMSNEVGTGEDKKLAYVNMVSYGPVATEMWNAVVEEHRVDVEAKMTLHDGKPFSVEEAADAAMRVLVGDLSEERNKVFHLNGGLWMPQGDPRDVSLDLMPQAA